MSYNVKNYTEQGGDKTVIGGELEVKEGARVGGLLSTPAKHQDASAATTVAALKDDLNALINKLKNAGIMVPDAWVFTTRIAPNVTGVGGRNNAKATVTIDGTDITITAPVDELEEYPSSNPAQGTHKWIGLGIGTGLSVLTKARYWLGTFRTSKGLYQSYTYNGAKISRRYDNGQPGNKPGWNKKKEEA